ncbi:MAG: hypothetical protein HY401_08565 [Elusimicrobia bacterium]|nr:hypothetical protein [Elusimicrobiota bacterium]
MLKGTGLSDSGSWFKLKRRAGAVVEKDQDFEAYRWQNFKEVGSWKLEVGSKNKRFPALDSKVFRPKALISLFILTSFLFTMPGGEFYQVFGAAWPPHGAGRPSGLEIKRDKPGPPFQKQTPFTQDEEEFLVEKFNRQNPARLVVIRTLRDAIGPNLDQPISLADPALDLISNYFFSEELLEARPFYTNQIVPDLANDLRRPGVHAFLFDLYQAHQRPAALLIELRDEENEGMRELRKFQDEEKVKEHLVNLEKSGKEKEARAEQLLDESEPEAAGHPLYFSGWLAARNSWKQEQDRQQKRKEEAIASAANLLAKLGFDARTAFVMLWVLPFGGHDGTQAPALLKYIERFLQENPNDLENLVSIKEITKHIAQEAAQWKDFEISQTEKVKKARREGNLRLVAELENEGHRKLAQFLGGLQLLLEGIRDPKLRSNLNLLADQFAPGFWHEKGLFETGRMAPRFKPNEKVVIAAGPHRGMEGRFEIELGRVARFVLEGIAPTGQHEIRTFNVGVDDNGSLHILGWASRQEYDPATAATKDLSLSEINLISDQAVGLVNAELSQPRPLDSMIAAGTQVVEMVSSIAKIPIFLALSAVQQWGSKEDAVRRSSRNFGILKEAEAVWRNSSAQEYVDLKFFGVPLFRPSLVPALQEAAVKKAQELRPLPWRSAGLDEEVYKAAFAPFLNHSAQVDPKRFSAGESPLPPDPRTSPDGSPRVLAGPLSTTGFKGDSPALNLYVDPEEIKEVYRLSGFKGAAEYYNLKKRIAVIEGKDDEASRYQRQAVWSGVSATLVETISFGGALKTGGRLLLAGGRLLTGAGAFHGAPGAVLTGAGKVVSHPALVPLGVAPLLAYDAADAANSGGAFGGYYLAQPDKVEGKETVDAKFYKTLAYEQAWRLGMDFVPFVGRGRGGGPESYWRSTPLRIGTRFIFDPKPLTGLQEFFSKSGRKSGRFFYRHFGSKTPPTVSQGQ